jgi:DNA polymerase III delta prime subunit
MQTKSTTPSEPILRAIAEGRPAIILVDGRDNRDLDVYPNTRKMGPLLEILREDLKERKILLFSYSLANGIDYESAIDDNPQNRSIIETFFRNGGLLDIPQDEQEFSLIIKRIADLWRSHRHGLQLSDGQKAQLCISIEFSEDLLPCNRGISLTEAQIIAIESTVVAANSLALRSSNNFIILHTRDAALIAPSVRAACHHIHLPQPSQVQKEQFCRVALDFYDGVRLEPGLTIDRIAHLTSNTPNRSLEALIRAASRTGAILTSKELTAQKSADVQSLSENVLTLLGTNRLSDEIQLAGRNSQYPFTILSKLSKSLAQQDPNMPHAVLLVGPPGTGKTEMCLGVGQQANVCVFQQRTPKNMYVGETERLVTLLYRILREWSPNISFQDEITEALNLQRNSADNDSGTSRAIVAEMLTALSDDSRRGKTLMIATTNCPDRMGAAMRSRFVMIPVLHPLQMDYPSIVVAIARRVSAANAEVDANHPAIIQAADIFYCLGANPRHIRSSLSNALLLKGEVTPATILFAAQDCTVATDRASAIYADLLAVDACTSKSFFPWNGSLDTYPFPEHLQSLVDLQSGDIDRDLLDLRIQEYKPHANL